VLIFFFRYIHIINAFYRESMTALPLSRYGHEISLRNRFKWGNFHTNYHPPLPNFAVIVLFCVTLCIWHYGHCDAKCFRSRSHVPYFFPFLCMVLSWNLTITFSMTLPFPNISSSNFRIILLLTTQTWWCKSLKVKVTFVRVLPFFVLEFFHNHFVCYNPC